MTKHEQTVFIDDLIASIRNEVMQRVPYFPDNWDGHQLREYVADVAGRSRSTLMIEDRRMKREYRNDVATRPL